MIDMEEGDDGFSRSFIVDLDRGTEVHLLSNHLLPDPAAPAEEDEGEGVGAV